MKEKNPNPNFRPPASVHIPEQARVEIPKPSQLITITVAEYHFLTKAATLLEVILADRTYGHENVVEAVRNTVEEMQRMAEAGAEE